MWYCIQIDAFKGSRDNCLFIKGFLKWQWTSGSTLCAHFRWFISVHFLWDFPLLCCCFSIFHLLRFLASPELSFFGYVLKGCNICVWVSLRGRRRQGPAKKHQFYSLGQSWAVQKVASMAMGSLTFMISIFSFLWKYWFWINFVLLAFIRNLVIELSFYRTDSWSLR